MIDIRFSDTEIVVFTRLYQLNVLLKHCNKRYKLIFALRDKDENNIKKSSKMIYIMNIL